MTISWCDKLDKVGSATLYDTNVTLNTIAISLIPSAYRVMLGVDEENKKIIIKPISKEGCLRGDIPETSLYKITIKSSYGRISSTEFMKRVSKIINYDFVNGQKKYEVVYNTKEGYLEVNLRKEIK